MSEVSFCSLLPESVLKLILRGRTCLKTKTVFETELFDETILPVVALAAQGRKWSSCAPTLLDVHALGKAVGDNSVGFSDLHYASLSTGYQKGQSDPMERWDTCMKGMALERRCELEGSGAGKGFFCKISVRVNL